MTLGSLVAADEASIASVNIPYKKTSIDISRYSKIRIRIVGDLGSLLQWVHSGRPLLNNMVVWALKSLKMALMKAAKRSLPDASMMSDSKSVPAKSFRSMSSCCKEFVEPWMRSS